MVCESIARNIWQEGEHEVSWTCAVVKAAKRCGVLVSLLLRKRGRIQGGVKHDAEPLEKHLEALSFLEKGLRDGCELLSMHWGRGSRVELCSLFSLQSVQQQSVWVLMLKCWHCTSSGLSFSQQGHFTFLNGYCREAAELAYCWVSVVSI